MTRFAALFTKQAASYAQFRPEYPQELYDSILEHVKGRELAWDCATGTGQAARDLARRFKRVVATDVSQQQIQNASGPENVQFKVLAAEATDLASGSVDLITVAQAIHWFDWDRFYSEAKRVLKPDGLFAAWGYGFFTIDPAIDAIIDPFSREYLKEYWTERNWLLVEGYKRLPFPFERLEAPEFSMTTEWDLHQVVGYFTSWSAYQKCKDATGTEPLETIAEALASAWSDPQTKREVRWPIYLLMGRL